MGSIKVLRVALGAEPSDEHRTNLHQLSERMHGSMGLLFTKLPREQVGRGRCREEGGGGGGRGPGKGAGGSGGGAGTWAAWGARRRMPGPGALALQ